MMNAGVYKFIFSSSASVYGDPTVIPLSERHPVNQITNPYGRSKLMIEDILVDLAASDPRWRIAILRYFNPVGAHHSGLIGEDSNDIPNNLLPYITQVASGKLPKLQIFGCDYHTHDGTGVRDYIHVVDLADGHVRAFDALEKLSGAHVWNLGTGKGYSVLEIVHAFEEVSGKKIPYYFGSRRTGDVSASYADVTKAKNDLSWEASRGLREMMHDTWRWQQMNPNGYK